MHLRVLIVRNKQFDYLSSDCTCINIYSVLFIFIYREKTDLKFSGRNMEPCLDTKFRSFMEPTEISQRAVLSLLKIRPIDVEFSDITLTVRGSISDISEYLCISLNF
jgi:hypothetical protein